VDQDVKAVLEADVSVSANSTRSSEMYFYTSAEISGDPDRKVITKSHGPVSANKMKRLWKNSKIGASTLVWRQGIEEWSQISKLPDLHQFLDPEWDSDAESDASI
jgi:hypothetical protein